MGAKPGEMAIPVSALPTKMQAICFGADHYEASNPTCMDQVKQLCAQDCIVWLNVEGLENGQLLRELAEFFAIHPLALADVVHTDQRPKVEIFPTHLFIVLRMLHEGERLQHEQISLFVGKRFVLTFQERPGDCFGLIRERLQNPDGRIRKMDAVYLGYALLDAIVDGFFAPLETIEDQLDELEAAVLDSKHANPLHSLHLLKRDLLVARRAVWPLREAISSLLRSNESEWVNPDNAPFLRDTYDHTVQVMDMLETYRELVSGQMELYVSTLGLRTNDVMKVLTMFASVFIPLTFIVGIYGMNFDPEASPWNMPELGWRYGYPGILAFMLLVSGGILFLFKRRGWF